MFDRDKLKIRQLKERIHNLDLKIIKPLEEVECFNKNIKEVAVRIKMARQNKKNIVMMIGGHVIRSGAQKYIIDLIQKGYISCLAMNGSCVIHDYEFSLIGATTESVSHYIKEGQFGLWNEVGEINQIINQAYNQHGLGMGKAIGKAITKGNFPYKDISLLSACDRLNIPATVHVGIGYDIIHQHPNCDGAATGETSYRDFLVFAQIIEGLEGGVLMVFGSAVMGPEVFLKALSMARNLARQNKKDIRHFTTLVCDLQNLPDDFSREPPKDNPAYYFRPWKTLLVRTVADGGESFYVRGEHAETIPALWSALNVEGT